MARTAAPPAPAFRVATAHRTDRALLRPHAVGRRACSRSSPGCPQLGVAIFVVVVLNGVFAFVQEYRAERAAERLRDLLPRRVTVIRDGTRVEIDAAGARRRRRRRARGRRPDLAPTCASTTRTRSLVDTSMLTGESAAGARRRRATRSSRARSWSRARRGAHGRRPPGAAHAPRRDRVADPDRPAPRDPARARARIASCARSRSSRSASASRSSCSRCSSARPQRTASSSRSA